VAKDIEELSNSKKTIPTLNFIIKIGLILISLSIIIKPQVQVLIVVPGDTDDVQITVIIHSILKKYRHTQNLIKTKNPSSHRKTPLHH